MEADVTRVIIVFIVGSLVGSLLSLLIPFLFINSINPWWDFLRRWRKKNLSPSMQGAKQLEQLIRFLGSIDTWLSSDDFELVVQVRTNLWKQLKYLEIVAFFYRVRFTNNVNKQSEYLRTLFLKGEEANKAIDIISKDTQINEETRKIAKQYLNEYRIEKRSKGILQQASTRRISTPTQTSSQVTKTEKVENPARKKRNPTASIFNFYRGKPTINLEKNTMNESKDSYNINQAGAVGPNAHAHDMSIQQINQTQKNELDLFELAKELEFLRKALKENSTDPEHDAQIGAIALAEIEAQKGDEAKVIQYLKQTGKWALDIATNIGVTIAVAAITKALGLG